MRADVDYVGLYDLLRGCDEITPTGFTNNHYHEITYSKKGRVYRAWCHDNGDGTWRFTNPEETRRLNKNVL